MIGFMPHVIPTNATKSLVLVSFAPLRTQPTSKQKLRSIEFCKKVFNSGKMERNSERVALWSLIDAQVSEKEEDFKTVTLL